MKSRRDVIATAPLGALGGLAWCAGKNPEGNARPRVVVPIPDFWYETVTLAAGIVRIREPLTHPYVRANSFWIQGRDRDLIFDCGLGVKKLREELPEIFENNPILVISHYHLDHAGGASQFPDVAAHEYAAKILARGSPGTLTLEGMTSGLGLPYEDPDPNSETSLLYAPPHRGYDVTAYRVPKMTPSRTLKSGDIIDLGSRALEVLHLPGHSPDTLGLIDRKNRIFLSGDALYKRDLIDTFPDSSVLDYLATMEKILHLDVSLTLPGHQDVLNGEQTRAIAKAYIDSKQHIQ